MTQEKLADKKKWTFWRVVKYAVPSLILLMIILIVGFFITHPTFELLPHTD